MKYLNLIGGLFCAFAALQLINTNLALFYINAVLAIANIVVFVIAE